MLVSFPKAHIANKWLVTIAVTLGMFMSVMDNTIVNVAIPHLQTTFNADLYSVQWVVTVYMLTQAAVIPTAPYLMMRFGGRNAYVGTLVAFLLGSVLCGFAWDLPSLIFFRFIQGIGGGILLPLVTALLYQAFDPQERSTAVSAMGIPLMVAPAFGPVLGGYLVGNLGWQWAFFINIPMGIFSIILSYRVLSDKSKTLQKIPAFDLFGFLTIATGSTAVLYGVSAVASGEGGQASLMNALILGGVIFLIFAFILIELVKIRHTQEPLLDLRCFSDRTFAFSNFANVFVTFTRFGTMFLITIYLQNLRHQTTFEAGAMLGVQALASMAVLPIGGRLAKRFGPRPVVLVGIALFATAAVFLVNINLNTPIWLIVANLILIGSAFGCYSQIPVITMWQVKKEADKKIVHGTTLLNVLQATSAPIGVALMSGLAQAGIEQHRLELIAQGFKGEQLPLQSSLLAMHDSFGIAVGLALAALLIVAIGVPAKLVSTKLSSEATSKQSKWISQNIEG